MKKIAHEAPLSIAPLVRELTDYDYALVHLFLKPEGEKYFKFFKDSLGMGREVILDNSAYELGDSFDPDIYYEWISKLRPTYYIVPDCPGNCEETIRRAEKWFNRPGLLERDMTFGLKTIGVVQGSTYEEIVKCYNFWKDAGVDKIAFTFYYPFYDDNKLDDNKYVSLMLNRQQLITRLLCDNVIDTTKKHHLLGCWLPQEFKFYKKEGMYDWIDSIDTSNPVLHGIEEELYEDEGLFHKSSVKMESLMFKPAKDFIPNYDIIEGNIIKFKEFVR